MVSTITDMLNRLNDLGFFSYVLPFLIVFAIVFGILQKAKIFGDEKQAKGVNSIIAVGVAGLSLLYDIVPTFFSVIFPRFGVGLAVFLVLVIALGFFYTAEGGNGLKSLTWIGWIVGVGVVLWAFNEWSWYGGGSNIGYLFQEYLPLIIVLALIGGGIAAVVGKKDK